MPDLIGGLAVLAVIGVIAFVVWKNKNKNYTSGGAKEDDDNE